LFVRMVNDVRAEHGTACSLRPSHQARRRRFAGQYVARCKPHGKLDGIWRHRRMERVDERKKVKASVRQTGSEERNARVHAEINW
jgi:hypothetical protein